MGLQAKALVVIAERHLGEFRAIADYLNHAAEILQDAGIGVFLVEFGVSKVEGFYVPRFEVVARPNAWLQQLPGSDKVPMLASVDEFYEKCTPESGPRFREIIEDWERTQPGAYVNYNAQRAVALYRSNPMKGSSGRTAVYLLETNGWLTINRGYLLDGGLGATEEDIAAFDAAMTTYLPGHQRTEKNYYPKLKDPDPAQVRAFNKWLDGALGAASTAAKAAG